MRQISTLIFLFFMAALPLTLQATHIVGGEMTYKCLGNDQYEIKLTIFRDCYNGIPWFDDPAAIGVFSYATNAQIPSLSTLVPLDPILNDTIDPTLDDDCLAVPPNVCVNTTTYTTVMTLPFLQGGYYLSYQRCCRNNTIINLIAPEDVGATYGVVLTEEAMLACNSSPVFKEWPPLYLCANVPFNIDQSAIDIDGDSLVYKLCNPLNGASMQSPMPQPPNPPPYDTVPWLPPYDANSMINLPPNPPMVIDPVTGMLTGTPTLLGQFVIGICVEEYRNGELIGMTSRDYQVNIGDCQAVVAAFANADGQVTCGTKTVTFENNSINATEYLWLFNDPNNPGASSTEENPVYTFNQFGEYEVELIANPGAICADTTSVLISVQPNSLTADFDVQVIECLENVILQVIDLSVDTFSAPVSWEWVLNIGGNMFTSNEQNPSFEVTPPGGAILSLTVTNAVGCSQTFEDIFPIKPPLLNLDLGPDITSCEINQEVLDAGEGFSSYLWSDNSTGQMLTINAPGTYSVTVTDVCGDTKTDMIAVAVDAVVVDAGEDIHVCFPGQTVTLSGSITGNFINFQWEPAAGLSDPNSLTPDVFVAATTTFTLSAVSNATTNILVNGDFEAGSTGFTSDYIPGTGGSFGLLSNEGEYAVAVNPNLTHTNFANCTDHTSGTGNMMVVNGAPTANESIWCQTVAVAPGTNYQFSAWMTSVVSASPAVLQFSINGGLLGNPFNLTGTTCLWENFFENWNAGLATSAEICIVNQNTAISGNDFAIDDIFFGPVCIGSDEVTVFVDPLQETFDTLSICAGDSVIIFGTTVSQAGDYAETFTSSTGCDSTHTVTVNVLDINETSETIGICNGETADVFGTPVDTAGVFSETFTGQNGCDSVHTITVVVFPTYHFVQDAQICDGDTVFVFGNPVTTTSEFSDTLQTINGCDSIQTINVAVLPNAFTNESREICFGETTDIFGMQIGIAGTYDQTFTAVNGCDSTHSIFLEVYAEITVMTSTTDASCFGIADGTATAIASGGNGGFIYAWSNGDQLEEAVGLAAGDHTVTVTDVTGCSVVATVTIGQPAEVEVVGSGVNISCTELGSVSASASGGAGNFTYEWNTGDTTADVDSLFAGVYTVTATDGNGCTGTISVVLTGALAPTIQAVVDQQLTIAEPNSGEISVAITGGTMPYDIVWNNGSTSDSLFNLSSGQYIVTVTDAQGCVVTDTVYLFVAACTGGKIWNDRNQNGCQNGGEFGIEGVEMSLLGTDIWGNSVIATTTSTINGEYIFEPLPPGEYVIFMEIPTDYNLSPADACADNFVDSDFDVNGVATELVTLVEGHCCLIIDGGLYDECGNVYNPGTICCDQTLCGPGNLAAPITSNSPAAGANQVEYRWVYSEVSGSNPGWGSWSVVKDIFGNPVTTMTLNPGPVYVTTYYARCVRAVGCAEWLVTDVVTITVGNEAVAIIDEPGAICVGDPVQFTAAANGAGANYLWNFGPTATPSLSNDPAPVVTFSQNGYPTVYLTVTNNGCTSTDNLLIAVSNDPVYCGTAINNGGQNGLQFSELEAAIAFRIYPNPVHDKVSVEWGKGIETDVQVEILSVEGKLLVSQKVAADAQFFTTDLSDLHAGIYLMRLRHSDGAQEVFKLVKQ